MFECFMNLPVLSQGRQMTAKVAEDLVAAEPLLPGLVVFLIVTGMLSLPFLFGRIIARSLKLKDLSLKIGLILFALELGLAPFVSQYVVGWLERNRYERELAKYEAREERHQVTPAGIEAIKKQISGLEVVPRAPRGTAAGNGKQ